jgi:hypothetical protein
MACFTDGKTAGSSRAGLCMGGGGGAGRIVSTPKPAPQARVNVVSDVLKMGPGAAKDTFERVTRPREIRAPTVERPARSGGVGGVDRGIVSSVHHATVLRP